MRWPFFFECKGRCSCMRDLRAFCKDSPRPQVARYTPSAHPTREPVMTDRATYQSLLAAVARCFDPMFDNDVSRFDQEFASSAQGTCEMASCFHCTRMITTNVMASRTSPHAGRGEGSRQDRCDPVSRLAR